MHERFLKFSFAVLLALLWAIFAVFTGLTYWSPMRAWPMPFPFTISPLEWTAIWSYIATLVFVSAHQLTSTRRSLARLWSAICVCAIVFTTTALVLEYKLFYNARDPEKSDTVGIIFGCVALALLAAICASLLLIIIRRVQPNAPNPAMELTGSVRHTGCSAALPSPPSPAAGAPHSAGSSSCSR